MKYDKIRVAEPPIRLADQTSPGAKLLRELFKLLQKHYRTIDFDELRQYLPYPESPPKLPSLPVEETEPARLLPDAYQALGVKPLDRPSRQSTSTPSATRTLVASTTVTKVLLGCWVGSGMRSTSMGRPRIAFKTIKAPFFEETRLPSLQDGLSTPMID